MKTHRSLQILLPAGFDERATAEILLKGWLSVQVELEDGERYALYFSDPIRLQQDVDEATQEGKPCFAEPGLIIVPEVTVQAIQDAVQFLWKQGFFTALQPDRSAEVNELLVDETIAAEDKDCFAALIVIFFTSPYRRFSVSSFPKGPALEQRPHHLNLHVTVVDRRSQDVHQFHALIVGQLPECGTEGFFVFLSPAFRSDGGLYDARRALIGGFVL
jgi:hypothetical protein